MSVTATPASLAPDHHAQFIDLLQGSLVAKPGESIRQAGNALLAARRG